MDQAFLLGSDIAHQVADGQQAHQLAVVQHRQVAQVLLGHQLHAVLVAVAQGHHEQVGGHHLLDGGGVGRAFQCGDAANEVAFGDYAHQFAPLHHHQRADVLLGHQQGGFQHRGRRVDAENPGMGLGFEYLGDCFHSAAPEGPVFLVVEARRSASGPHQESSQNLIAQRRHPAKVRASPCSTYSRWRKRPTSPGGGRMSIRDSR
ncbi:hypothetical protein D9M70_276640 [compost metagenome]